MGIKVSHGGIRGGELPLQAGPMLLVGMNGIEMMDGTPQHGGTVLWLESKKPHGAEMEDGKAVPLMAIAMIPGMALTAVKIRAELGNRRRR